MLLFTQARLWLRLNVFQAILVLQFFGENRGSFTLGCLTTFMSQVMMRHSFLKKVMLIKDAEDLSYENSIKILLIAIAMAGC